MKPIIGVTPDFNAGNRKEWGGREPTYFLRARYIRAIEELGGIPLPRALVAQLVRQYDVDLDSPFDLPSSIREIRVEPGQVTVLQ